MLAIGAALDSTGAVALIVSGIAPTLETLPPWAIVWAIYLLTSILTELVTNNAVAVVVTPIAIGLATQMNVDPKAFLITVMFAANTSFITPVGYQTNTLVYGAGNYRFGDFLKVGGILTVIIWFLVTLLVYWIYL